MVAPRYRVASESRDGLDGVVTLLRGDGAQRANYAVGDVKHAPV